MEIKHKIKLEIELRSSRLDSIHDLINLFLINLPEDYGDLYIHHAEVVEGMVDEDEVPIQPKVKERK